jgi:4-amino-4-deoxy-L-arabinose transferase-like glycosyltransferase
MTRDEGRKTEGSVFRPSSFVLAIILAAYLGIGTLYAVETPAWQVPDEPAHYNYVRFIAEGRGLPVLQPGDYDQAYLESIKGNKFPPSMPIDSIRYEFWQPPLYYVLASPIYLVANGSLLALRLFSVALGAFIVVFAFLIVRQLAPGSPALALGTAAFVAFVPQHVAMMAGAQNDSLAELLLALVVYQFSILNSQWPTGRWAATGALLGLALVTKGTIYIVVPLAAAALWWVHRSQSLSDASWLVRRGALVFGPALVIALPWWIRNVVVYGWPDFLGSIRHDVVVTGQPTPAEWIARFGLGGYLREFAVTTFHSFWGQFGWMGVPMNDKYYAYLAAL